MFKLSLIGFIALCAVSISTPTFAASKKDAEMVSSIVLDNSIPFLSKTRVEEEDQTVITTVVIVENGMRYTIACYDVGVSMEYRSIQIWARKNGTSGPSALSIFNDTNLDGLVNEGWEESGGKQMVYDTVDSEFVMDDTFMKYWQSRYDKAIKDILAYKKYTRK